MREHVPALPVEHARRKLSVLAKEAWYYDVPVMNVTIGSYSMPVDEKRTNVTVGIVACKNPLMA